MPSDIQIQISPAASLDSTRIPAVAAHAINASGWRSALAAKTVQDMGLSPVSHIGEGFKGWNDAGGPVVKTEDGRESRS